jgi:hypothetical protein
MGIEIPDQLKAAVPQTLFGKLLASTPVVLAVLSTLLAGLASSEMTKAQYDRSLGAQQQSKAGDQWSFFQAKRLRGAYQSSTAELLQALSQIRPFDSAALRAAAQGDAEFTTLLNSDSAKQALDCLQRSQIPALPAPAAADPKVQAALDGLARLAPDVKMLALLAPVSDGLLEAAVEYAQSRTEALDKVTSPVNAAIDQIDAGLARVASAHAVPPAPSLDRDFTAARLRYTAVRYEAEARLNQAIANLYELQVRKSNISAERHHTRSMQFFIGMLAAQLGVIVATFALAAKQRNLLWTLAAAVGLLAIAFAIYVYLYI